MLSGFPVYHYFKNGNAFSGAEGSMRYLIAPGKDETGQACLSVTIWPGPWSLEHTDEEKQQQRTFDGDQAGLDAATAWLGEEYAAQRARWDSVPSLLDCEPDR